MIGSHLNTTNTIDAQAVTHRLLTGLTYKDGGATGVLDLPSGVTHNLGGLLAADGCVRACDFYT